MDFIDLIYEMGFVFNRTRGGMNFNRHGLFLTRKIGDILY